MDPLTHGLAGVVVSDLCPFPGRGRVVALWAAVAAVLPDIDTVPAFIAAFPANPFSASLFDADVMRAYHRGYTHALPVLLAAGLPLAAAAYFVSGRRGAWWRWLVVIFAAFGSHVVLDMANGAVRLWLPFSGEWRGWGAAAEASPLVLLPLILCVLTNHPPTFGLSDRVGTLHAVERAGGWLSRKIGNRFPAPAIALVTLLLVAAAMYFRGSVY